MGRPNTGERDRDWWADEADDLDDTADDPADEEDGAEARKPHPRPSRCVANRHSRRIPAPTISAWLIARRRPIEESDLLEDAQRVDGRGGQRGSQDGSHQPEEQRACGGGDEDHQRVEP